MPDMVSDIVDVYVFRRLSARVQFLLLQRRANVPLGNTWQSFHTQIHPAEATIAAGRRAVKELAGLNVSEVYSADYINEFYDDMRDVVVLAPVLAVNVSPQAPVTLGPEFRDCAWWDTNQAAARLPFAGQRWAVRHIDEIMSIGHAESQLYRLQLPAEDARPFNDEALAAIRESGEIPVAPESFESFGASLEDEPADGTGEPDEFVAVDESDHRTNVQ